MATLAVTMFLVATVACVLLADRPKGFELAQAMNFAPDEIKYLGPLMAKIGAGTGKQNIVVQNMGNIFSEKNRLASDKVAAAAVDASPEYQAAEQRARDATVAVKQAAAIKRLSMNRIKVFLRDSQHQHQTARDAIAKAVSEEKQAEAKLVHYARSNNVKILPASNSNSDLLKILSGGSIAAELQQAQSGASANVAAAAVSAISPTTLSTSAAVPLGASDSTANTAALSDSSGAVDAASINQPVPSIAAAVPAPSLSASFATARPSRMTAAEAAATAEDAVAEAQSVLNGLNLNF